MNTQTFYALGLMSGTSLDGLDICYVKFQKHEHWNFEILNAETLPYTSIWKEKLKNAPSISSEELLQLNSDYGFYLAEKTQDFIAKSKIENLDVIASHGHTIFHQPERKFTLQIGDGRAIKIISKIPTVYDFRTQDVLLGGSGAPFVPVGDLLLFHEFDACVNLGGFSNISFQENGQRIGFDICPVNIILNQYAQKLGFDFDDKGNLAKSGKTDQNLLLELNNLDFYSQNYPKSLGFEWCEANILPLVQDFDTNTILTTFTEHIAEQISIIINKKDLKKVLFTGGGAYNNFLIESIKSKTKAEITIPENIIIEFKEALIFAFMGILRLNNENNVLASVTGASQNHCTGILV
jgi:anhydro-N-acetylmuramic acid kinase